MALKKHLNKHLMHHGILLILIAGVLLTVGDFVLRSWVGSDNWKLYVIGVFFYFVALNFLARSYKFENIAIASVIMEIFNLLTYLLVSYFRFGEKLATLEVVGVVLGIAAIACFELA